MFRNWGFLLGEIWVLIILAALLGLFVGWLIWGRMGRITVAAPAATAAATVAASTVAAAAPVVAAPVATAVAKEPAKPAGLIAPRGVADDLKLINGIGPALEELCHKLGFWHFDQIAAWTDAEIAWVDSNLEGFKGRVTRDDWVGQAKILMATKS